MILQRAFRKIYSHVIRYRFNEVGDDVAFEPFSSFHNPKYITIKDGCYIGPGCRIEAWDKYLKWEYKPEIVLGREVKINSRCHLGAISSIVIEDGCLLGSGVFITDHSHGHVSLTEAQMHPSDRPLYSKGDVLIGRNTWIGENVTILPGVHIGECCVVGASAVVTKDVPAYSVVVGNPAKVVRCLID